jgi:hypothetical protein
LIYERFLTNLSKVELRSAEPVSIFEFTDNKIVPNKEVQKLMKEEYGDKIPLRRIVVLHYYPEWKLNQILSNNKNKQDQVKLVRMTQIIVLCKDCATKYNFPWEYAKDIHTNISNTELGTLGLLVKPVFDNIAASEIAQEEISTIMNKEV